MIKKIKHLFKLFEKKAVKIEKRIRLVISVVLLCVLMALFSSTYFEQAVIFLPILIVLTFFTTYFSLLEEISQASWFGLFIMPILTTIFFFLSYYLLPGRWLTRIPFIIFYAISQYAVLLCSNIFNVGVEKSLGLYRAAFSINFFYQTVISFLAFMLIFSFRQIFIINGILVGGISFILAIQLLWSIKLDKRIDKEIYKLAGFIALIISQFALIASFIPLKNTIYALLLTSGYYSISGLIYSYLDQRLFKETIREYLSVLGFVILITYLSISW